MPLDPASSNVKTTVNAIALDFLSEIQSRFPVCLSSDEFHFFPHGPIHGDNLTRWDDFSPNSVAEVVRRCSLWRQTLNNFTRSELDREIQTDIRLLQWVMTILIEQLEQARPHRNQPTFHLTIAGIGLAQAYEQGGAVWSHRLRGLPEFLSRAIAHFDPIPCIFRDRGLKMAVKLYAWLNTLARSSPSKAIKQALTALDSFRLKLKNLPTTKKFLLPTELYARIANTHLGIGLSLDAIEKELERELDTTKEILIREGSRLAPGCSWQEALAQLRPQSLAAADGYRMYREMITNLEENCIEAGLTSRSQAQASPVKVRPVPEYLISMRSAAAYSMEPGHPPRGGTFYLMPGDLDRLPGPDWHLLSAHETYPGHHLLDTARWNLEHAFRRHLEFPLFYEGWASFSEELLFHTGFCSGPRDRFLMAKRRYYRAIRGKVDLMMNRGSWDGSRAAESLCRVGYPAETAEKMLQRYALKPGYQLCYTLGRRRFRELHRKWTGKGGNLKDFCRRIMVTGEIHLDDLELHLARA